jgi:phosphoglucomutase/phosphopentomutase
VQKLVEDGDWKELGAIMAPRLEFGTAGIRGRMGPGFGRMNDLVIIQVLKSAASEQNFTLSIQVGQGLLAYLLTQEPNLTEKVTILTRDHTIQKDQFLWLFLFSPNCISWV